GLVVGACGGSTPSQGSDSGAGQDAAPGDSASPGDGPVATDGPAQSDAPATGDGPAATDGPVQNDTGTIVPDGGTYRSSLGVCWTDPACNRAMSIGHGGAWDAVNAPYDSNAAIINAFNIGMEGVKIDVRVTSDNVPVIAHSSPIQIYESVLCGIQGLVIEDSTAAQVTACLRAPSLTEHFQRLDEVLNYIRGKMVVQLCVKRSVDYQRTIQEIHALGAEDFAFIELGSAAELQTIIPTLTGADTVWYLVNVGSNVADVDTLIDVIHNPRAFMFEFDPTVNVSSLTPNRLHPAGIRSFTYDSATPISVATIQGYFEHGYDVVSSQNGPNTVQARINVNTARGISPP
ncbi:MAG: hypothetical protein HY906_20290, partial [Deltaproteobacteria bacterium]|nr:hypothetical protein [Deltaproteobacteria bacterium]